ncbi:MAG: hypothetical protein AAFO79_06610 [Pseudomonadota bacterium]
MRVIWHVLFVLAATNVSLAAPAHDASAATVVTNITSGPQLLEPGAQRGSPVQQRVRPGSVYLALAATARTVPLSERDLRVGGGFDQPHASQSYALPSNNSPAIPLATSVEAAFEDVAVHNDQPAQRLGVVGRHGAAVPVDPRQPTLIASGLMTIWRVEEMVRAPA